MTSVNLSRIKEFSHAVVVDDRKQFVDLIQSEISGLVDKDACVGFTSAGDAIEYVTQINSKALLLVDAEMPVPVSHVDREGLIDTEIGPWAVSKMSERIKATGSDAFIFSSSPLEDVKHAASKFAFPGITVRYLGKDQIGLVGLFPAMYSASNDESSVLRGTGEAEDQCDITELEKPLGGAAGAVVSDLSDVRLNSGIAEVGRVLSAESTESSERGLYSNAEVKVLFSDDDENRVAITMRYWPENFVVAVSWLCGVAAEEAKGSLASLEWELDVREEATGETQAQGESIFSATTRSAKLDYRRTDQGDNLVSFHSIPTALSRAKLISLFSHLPPYISGDVCSQRVSSWYDSVIVSSRAKFSHLSAG